MRNVNQTRVNESHKVLKVIKSMFTNTNYAVFIVSKYKRNDNVEGKTGAIMLAVKIHNQALEC